MNASDIERLQDDLVTLRTVAGVDLPFDRFDVRSTLVVGFCAMLPAVAALAGAESRWILLGSATPFLIAVLSGLWRNFHASHPSKACSHEKRKEYRTGFRVMLVCIPLLIGFNMWATRSGARPEVANGSILMFLGLMLLIEGLSKSSRRAAILPAAAAIIGGACWPYCEHLQLWTILWTCTGVALIGAAAIMHRQLVTRNP